MRPIVLSVLTIFSFSRAQKLPKLTYPSLAPQNVWPTSKNISAATAVLIAITRDDGPHLHRSIEIIRACLAPFHDYDVIVVENDSQDETPEILKNWSSSDRRVFVESKKGLSRNKRPSIDFLSQLRNRALELAFTLSYAQHHKYLRFRQHQWSADLVVVLDLDIAAVDVAGFHSAAAFVLQGRFAGATANGVYQDGRYYDLYAFRTCNLRYNSLLNGQFYKTAPPRDWPKLMPVFTTDLPPFPVDSAFSGMGIYSARVVFGPLPAKREGSSSSSSGDLANLQWRGQELSHLLGAKKEVRKKRAVPEKDGGDPRHPGYFAAAAVRAGRDLNLPCVYSTAGAQECEHVAFSACVNARAEALTTGSPLIKAWSDLTRRHRRRSRSRGIHMAPGFGVLYGSGISSQMQTLSEGAGMSPEDYLLPNPWAEGFDFLSVPQPNASLAALRTGARTEVLTPSSRSLNAVTLRTKKGGAVGKRRNRTTTALMQGTVNTTAHSRNAQEEVLDQERGVLRYWRTPSSGPVQCDCKRELWERC